MSKRKIALVYDCIYPYVKGGSERRFYELGKRLADRKTEVHLYGMKFWDGPKVIKRENLILHGLCKARPIYTKSGRRSITQALIFGVSSFKLVGADFDVIDCCGFPYFSMFPAKLAARIKGKPLYATWHEVWGKTYWREYLGTLGYAGYLVERLASRLPDQIITVIDSIEERLKNELGVQQKVHIIANGIDHSGLKKLQAADFKSDIIFVGRLMEFKHVDVLLKAVAKIKKQNPKVACNVVGDGPELEKLKKLSKQLRLTENVKFLGFIDDSAEVYKLMKASKVFVLPSTREGFGMVAIEAHACGLPVITIEDPNNEARHLVKPGINGDVVELNTKKIAQAIEEWLIAEESDHTVHVRHFDWEIISKKQAEVYSQ